MRSRPRSTGLIAGGDVADRRCNGGVGEGDGLGRTQGAGADGVGGGDGHVVGGTAIESGDRDRRLVSVVVLVATTSPPVRISRVYPVMERTTIVWCGPGRGQLA